MARKNPERDPAEGLIGANLERYRKSLKLSRAALAERMSEMLGRPINQQTILKLETGKMNMTEKWLNEFAQVYGRDPVDFMVDADEPIPPEGEARKAPAPTDTLESFIMPDYSMDRLIPKGAEVLVDPARKDLIPGKLYLIEYRQEKLVRRYGANPERWEPLSGQFHETLYPSRVVEILGRVVEAYIDLEDPAL